MLIADIFTPNFFIWRNGVTSRRYARKNQILEIFFKHPCIIYHWKAENKSSILIKKITEIDKFLTELLTFEVYDVIVSPVWRLAAAAATDASNRKFSPLLSSFRLKSLIYQEVAPYHS